MSDVRKQNSKSVLKSVIPVLHIGQTGLTFHGTILSIFCFPLLLLLLTIH
jgi:hypothetical protein